MYWFEDLQYPLMTGIAVGTLCSLLSVIVVLKRMAFIGQGISHAGFGGIGTAIFLGLSGLHQDLAVLGFCILTALVIGKLTRRQKIEPDSAIAILLVAAMAWGVLIDEARAALLQGNVEWYVKMFGFDAGRSTFEQLLFGSILSVTFERTILAVVLATLVLAICVALFKELLFFAFDEEVSRVFGVSNRLMHYLMLVLLAITIVISIRLAGFVLVSALLVIPGATALQLSRRLPVVFLWAWIVGTVGLMGGLLLSYFVLDEFSTGPCIVSVLCVMFGVVYGGRALTGA